MVLGLFKRNKPFPSHESRFFELLSSQSLKTVEGLEFCGERNQGKC
jgi:hypothetical protein